MVIEINEMIDALEEFFNSSGHEFIVGGIAGRVEGNSSIVNVSSDIAVTATYYSKYNKVNKDNMNYAKAIGFKTNTDANGRQVAEFSEIDRMLTIEMDSELIQGAKLEIWYSITVTNNSEIDYEYEKEEFHP